MDTPQRLTFDELTSLRGQAVYAFDGDKIGTADTVYYDETTSTPEWLGVSTETGFLSALFGGKHVLVPVEGASIRPDRTVFLRYSKDQVKDAPQIDTDREEITEDEERRLYSHYNLQRGYNTVETTTPVARARLTRWRWEDEDKDIRAA